MKLANFLVFHDLDSFENSFVRYFAQRPLIGVSGMLFSWLDWVMGLGRKISEGKCHFHRMVARYLLSMWLMTDDVNGDHLAEIAFAGFSTTELLSSLLPHSIFWTEVIVCTSSLTRRQLEVYAPALSVRSRILQHQEWTFMDANFFRGWKGTFVENIQIKAQVSKMSMLVN